MSDYLENMAFQLHDELGQNSGISPAYIKNWMIANVGLLNTYLNTNYSGVTGSISPQISGDAQVIFKELFTIKFYDRLIFQNLGAGAYGLSDTWTTLKEADSSVQRISKTSIAQSYQVLKKEAQIKLDDLIKMHRSNNSHPLSNDLTNTWISSDPMSYIELK